MEDRPGPVQRQSLSDELAARVRQLIRQNGYRQGDRLPSIGRMAAEFGVAPPTVREGLRKLEMLGVVEIRHGAGVFVGPDTDPLLMTNPISDGTARRTLLLDLVDARLSIELTSVALAAENATDAHLARMRQALRRAAAGLERAGETGEPTLDFHREIARGSGNVVLHQLLDALGGAMRQARRVVDRTPALRQRFHAEHLGILDALERRDADQAVERMRAHLRGVREALQAGSPDTD
ncbi:FadR/GntR family transcriptional regulator [Longimicrobium sp.]|uniref:FadR/GntR family transcriptional regulator n=1 Tax=Longimicrobium sp. TaxID=2029185 RepID=UPI002E331C2E|nr:FadR/GntR family transcriptional regulator [Longimicrobium sp.]HEX6041339.1 FadR/GntR family transcriptional regulator [Longimicrobium sp.]